MRRKYLFIFGCEVFCFFFKISALIDSHKDLRNECLVKDEKCSHAFSPKNILNYFSCKFCVTSAMQWNHMKVSISIDDDRWWLDHTAIKTELIDVKRKFHWWKIFNDHCNKAGLISQLLRQINPCPDKCDYHKIHIVICYQHAIIQHNFPFLLFNLS